MIDYDEWARQIAQRNRELDDIIIELLISMLNMLIGDHPTRKRRRYRDGQREKGKARIMEDYIVGNSTFDEVIFRRKFQMRKPLFLQIVSTITSNDIFLSKTR